MDFITEETRETPVAAEADVLVCGGGVAGVAAAICAARNNAQVLLVERYGFLGGLCTGGLVLAMPRLNNGLNSEIRQRLEDAGVYKKCVDKGDPRFEETDVSAIDAEVLKYEFIRMLLKDNVKLLLHTYVVKSIVQDGAIKGVIVESKNGRTAILARLTIDATGDADVAAAAGAPFDTFPLDQIPTSIMFNMADVDIEKALAQLGSWKNLREVIKEGMEKGELAFDLDIYPGKITSPGVFAMNLCYPGELNVWTGSLYGIDGLKPEQLTEAEIIIREHVMRLAAYLKKKLSGFEKSRIECSAPMIGVRQTRRIVGERLVSLNEAITQKFKDTVVKPYSTKEMRLPYGCLVPKGVENLLVAGRCMSTSPEGLLRNIAVCLATGQSAGTAAALALKENAAPRELDVSLIQRTLVQQGMDLGL